MNNTLSHASGLEPDLDPVALRARYRIERDRRLRPDGNAQYVDLTGAFAHYLEDPYVEPIARAAVEDEVDIVVVGGGFGGLQMGARLRQAGFDSIRMIEKGGDFGGTWYWNRYPGAACDIESYIYMPLIEEVGVLPTEKYARGPEIAGHARAIGERFDLYRDAMFQTEVKTLDWDEASARWTIRTDRGDVIRARFVVVSAGPFNIPKLPGIPGVEGFRGHSFHTSRWDYGYTGGDASGGLAGLADKTVGIIGTGATAVQCIPHLGRWAKQLYVFQRTPSAINVRDNRPTDPDWAASLAPGWQKPRMLNFTTLVSGGHQDEDLVGDAWTDIFRTAGLFGRRGGEDPALTPEEMAERAQMQDFRKMERIRARVDEIVHDKATAEALKPWYNQFCKRPCFHDEYLQTFNLPNVTLVDTKGKGVERITENAAIVDGKAYEVDCLIYATGFRVGEGLTHEGAIKIRGRGGLTMAEKWKDGAATLHGIQVNGFPNLLLINLLTQVGISPNVPHTQDEVAVHIAHLLDAAREAGATTLEATAEAEEEWLATVQAAARARGSYAEDCTPGYYNAEGQPSTMAVRNGVFGAGPINYFQILADWRADGQSRGVRFDRR
jgi:cyclohexanone monooxygenase